MRDPQSALEAARAAASQAAAEPAGEQDFDDPALGARRLVEWAIIEPEEATVYSTRRFGGPITVLKRLLVRLLRQYLNEVSAQQSRFNSVLAAHVLRLEERVQELEQERRGEGPSTAGEPPPA